MDRAETRPEAGPRRSPTLAERFRDWKHRTIARPGFQRWAAAFPLTRPVARKHARELFDLLAGFVYSQILLACVRLGVFKMLADGPLPLATVAERCGLSLEAARRLVAAADSLELLDLQSGYLVTLGRLGAPLVANEAITAMVEHHATLYSDLTDPVALLRGQGRPAMAGYWPYAAAAEAGPGQPATLATEKVAEYSKLMTASQPLVAREVIAAYRFGRHKVLMDVGGGEGAFVRCVAAEVPGVELRVFDLPAVAERANENFQRWGLAGRAQAFGGDFFADELPRGADVISLVRVAFDHPDERVLTLFKNVRRALPDNGTLVLAEAMAEVPGVEPIGDAYFGFYLLAMGRGRPRSAARLTQMLHEAGFASVRPLSTHMPLQAGVLVARCTA
ncbi:methyltransferase [Rubrivivax gelatinosus]|uniref:methyltransferase n=1 Tax=Rubrivivax gelatinosus TaxID=28068 RepID=UPI0002D336E2|nr:methyltransferase [Rubrivivax gelatinosus]MBG6078630.1 demethylspheroidene O-methyltransferase [Rubrivivax gelatinosus]